MGTPFRQHAPVRGVLLASGRPGVRSLQLRGPGPSDDWAHWRASGLLVVDRPEYLNGRLDRFTVQIPFGPAEPEAFGTLDLDLQGLEGGAEAPGEAVEEGLCGDDCAAGGAGDVFHLHDAAAHLPRHRELRHPPRPALRYEDGAAVEADAAGDERPAVGGGLVVRAESGTVPNNLLRRSHRVSSGLSWKIRCDAVPDQLDDVTSMGRNGRRATVDECCAYAPHVRQGSRLGDTGKRANIGRQHHDVHDRRLHRLGVAAGHQLP